MRLVVRQSQIANRKSSIANRYHNEGVSMVATFRATLGVAAATLLSSGLAAQQDDRWADLDSTRLWFNETTMFVPFHVTETFPLRQAHDDGTLQDDDYVVILEWNGGRLALSMAQTAYHHVVQGEMNGEPWMVSF